LDNEEDKEENEKDEDEEEENEKASKTLFIGLDHSEILEKTIEDENELFRSWKYYIASVNSIRKTPTGNALGPMFPCKQDFKNLRDAQSEHDKQKEKEKVKNKKEKENQGKQPVERSLN